MKQNFQTPSDVPCFQYDAVNKVNDLSFFLPQGQSLDVTVARIQGHHFHLTTPDVYLSFGVYCQRTKVLPFAFYCGQQPEQYGSHALMPLDAASIRAGIEAVLGTLHSEHPIFWSRKNSSALCALGSDRATFTIFEQPAPALLAWPPRDIARN